MKNAALEIEAEPYHTVDYFASQGIKIIGQRTAGQVGNKKCASLQTGSST